MTVLSTAAKLAMTMGVEMLQRRNMDPQSTGRRAS